MVTTALLQNRQMLPPGLAAQIEQVCGGLDTELAEKIRELANIVHVLSGDEQLILPAAYFFLQRQDTENLLNEQQQACLQELTELDQQKQKWLPVDVDAVMDGSSDHHMLLLSIIHDVRVIFVLLSRQLIVMRHIKSAEPEQRRYQAAISRTVYIPLANRLGIGQLKWEMEDLSFRFLDEEHYKFIASSLEEKRTQREKFIERTVATLNALLDEQGIQAEVYGRPKHIYSIWKKMQSKALAFDELYDIRALRVITQSVKDCYSVLGLVHSRWKYIPKEYDDYIAAPKANGYQSLHTAVYSDEQQVFEVQIRTAEMHQLAELGVAAHWRYKEGSESSGSVDKWINNIRALLMDNDTRAVDVANVISQDSIYVLTPQGRIIKLSRGATPIDFAYMVHTSVGHRCRGAKVNGKMVPLTTPLKSGQQVEILLDKNEGPSRDWLSTSSGYINSPKTRSKVRQWFKAQFRDEYIQQGKQMLAKQCDIDALEKQQQNLRDRFNVQTLEDLYAAVGRGELGPKQVANSLQQSQEKPVDEESVHLKSDEHRHQGQSIAPTIEGIGEIWSQAASCCKPIPGDEVLGFVSQGRGVIIHRRECKNIKALMKSQQDKILQVDWRDARPGRYETDVRIVAYDRAGLLRDITSLLSSMKISVYGANTRSMRRTNEAVMTLTIEVSDREQLQQVLAKLTTVKSVFTAERT